MKHIVTLSGGKDSQATLVWANENLQDYEIVFCDVKWERAQTYAHIDYLQSMFGKTIKVLVSSKYDGFIDMVKKKGRFPSTKARFCTEELKVKPMIDYILSCNEDLVIIQGVRADESASRRNLKANDEYFKFYFEPFGYDKKGKPKYHSYRKKDIVKHLDKYTVDVTRPILKWTADEAISYSLNRDVKINPTYFIGAKRVGCWPCVMCTHQEIKIIAEIDLARIDEIEELEELTNSTFFPPGYIPQRFCSKKVIRKDGTYTMVPTIRDVVRYVSDDKNQLTMYPQNGGWCLSVYAICEK